MRGEGVETFVGLAQVLQALPETPGEWEVRLGHMTVLETVLAHARIPRVRFQACLVFGKQSLSLDL